MSFLGRVVFLAASVTIATIGALGQLGSLMRGNLLEISRSIGRKEVSALIQDAVGDLDIDQERSFVACSGPDVVYDTNYLNELLKNTTTAINSRLTNELAFSDSKRNLAYRFEVPLGLAYNNAYLVHFGPSIPVLYELIGDFRTSLSTVVDSFGINNAMVKLLISITFQTQVVLPFVGDKTEFSYEIPVAINIIKGEVPFDLSGTKEIAGVSSIEGSYSKI